MRKPTLSGLSRLQRKQQAKFWERRAAMSMARLWRDQGKRKRPAIVSLRSTAGSPKDLTRAILRRPRYCSMIWQFSRPARGIVERIGDDARG